MSTKTERMLNMIPINKRKIWVSILLSIVTFGIYQIYWQYLLVKNIRAIQKDESSCTGEMLCLILIPFYFLFWWFTRGKIVKDKFAEHGYTASGNETAYLILGIFGLAIVSMAIMQNDFNSICSESTRSIQISTINVQRRPITVQSIVLAIICIIYIMPILIVLMNSFKTNASVNTDTFAFPNSDTFVGFKNYIKGMTFGNYPFYKSVFFSFFITIVSTALILLCTSMAAWYIARVGSPICKIVYYLCIFSMVVPFQMVMFTLSRTADALHLNTPWTIPIIYLGFGAGLAVFMFVGFVKSIPIEIEEAAAIDGCSPVRTFFSVVLPMMKPTMISVGILEIMWIWNDFLLPYLVLDRNLYMTIPIHIQYLKGSYGTVDLGATMALIVLGILPVIIFYLLCQKYIIKGVAAGAVKG